MSVGPWQIAIIALIVLLLFGATRLGDIGKGLGEGIRNFKKGISEDPDPTDDPESATNDSPKELKATEDPTVNEPASHSKKES